MPYTDHYEKYLNEIPGNIEKCKETGDRIVFGYTSDLDVLLTYNEDEFNKLVDTYVKGDIYRDGDENITDLESFSRIIAYYMANGLGGEADDMDIHPVQPHPHGAPQARGAEGKLIKKAGFDLLVIALDGCQLCLLGGREGRAVQPCMISIKIGHIVGPPINKIRWDMLLWTLYHRQA